MRGKLFEKPQNGKTQRKERIIHGIKVKRRESRIIENKKAKKQWRKDYGRLRSVNENEREVKKEKNGKRRLN